MTLPGQSLSPRRSASDAHLCRGFSLIELIVVASVVSLLLALAAPSLLSLGPTRKTGIHEVAGFLENARARAIAGQRDILVAFADRGFPGENGPYRAYALFAIDEPGPGPVPVPGSSEKNPPRQLSPWRSLPKGLVFAHGEHFEVSDGTAFRTLLDSSERRDFPVSGDFPENGGEIPLPYLMFGPDGGIRVPSFANADALHIGLAEGFFDGPGGKVEFTRMRPGIKSARLFPNGECLEIGFYTGRSRILTD